MKFSTRAIHTGSEPDQRTWGAIVPPLYLASTYTQVSAETPGDYDYGRSGNPTRSAFETTIASLESAKHALAYPTGMAAIHGVCMLLKPGDHVVAATDIYGGTYRLLHKVLIQAGIQVSLAPATDLQQLRKACNKNTKLIWTEAPGNPLFSIPDIQACAELAGSQHALLAVDSTFASPVLTQPLALGADIVVHSATKYIGGHSDLLGGVVCTNNDQLADKLRFLQNATGSVMSAFDAFLASRGLKTLELRVRAQSQSAFRIACFLNEHPDISRVWYPGLAEHEGHQTARRQMSGGFGSVLSFEVNGSAEHATRVVNGTRLFHTAVSIGAVESIIEQPAFMSHASYDPKDRLAHGLTDGLIRISVGLEDTDDLIRDLYSALSFLRNTRNESARAVTSDQRNEAKNQSLPAAVSF